MREQKTAQVMLLGCSMNPASTRELAFRRLSWKIRRAKKRSGCFSSTKSRKAQQKRCYTSTIPSWARPTPCWLHRVGGRLLWVSSCWWCCLHRASDDSLKSSVAFGWFVCLRGHCRWFVSFNRWIPGLL